MPKKIPPAFYFIGNHPVLDFINTRIAVDGKPVDLLDHCSDILDWLRKSNLLGDEALDEYGQRWESDGERESVVHEARALRSSLMALIKQGIKENEAASWEGIERINTLLENRLTTTKLIRRDDRLAAERQIKFQKPDDLLIPIAEAAVDFLTQYDLSLVKKCENPDCWLYFYDNSKNRTRRWCSQKACGNRMKVAAFLKRRSEREAKES